MVQNFSLGVIIQVRLPIVFEDHPVKFYVFRRERKKSDGCSVIDWERLGDVRNWVKLGFRVTGVRVVKTSKSVIVHPGPLKGFNVDQLEVDSGRIVEQACVTSFQAAVWDAAQ